MNKNTVYILQKDFGFLKKDTPYTFDGGDFYYAPNGTRLPKIVVEGNSYFFKLKEEVNESKPTEQFIWTDELAIEFARFTNTESTAFQGRYADLELFKQSKSKKEEPQWEILEFKNLRSGIVYIKKDNGKFNSGNGLDWDLEKFDIKDHEIINSVKRFPDNTVWSVDMVTNNGRITGFHIEKGIMVAEFENNTRHCDLMLLIKAPKETPKPEWEILKLEIGGVNYPIDALNEKEKSIAKIYSVKRLSDGEVFSVGDKVISDANIQAPHTVIDSITIVNDYMIYFNSIPFDRAIKVKLEAPNEEQVVKLYTESELLQACRDAFSSGYTRGWHNGCFEEDKTLSKKITDKKFEDYINSLK